MYTLKLAVATHLLLWGVCHGAPQGVSGEEYSGGEKLRHVRVTVSPAGAAGVDLVGVDAAIVEIGFILDARMDVPSSL